MPIVPTPIVPLDLTIPEPGSTTSRQVLSQALRRVGSELAGLITHPPAGAHEEGALFKKLLHDMERGALMSLLRRPTIGGLVRCLRDPGAPRREELYVALLAQCAFELQLAGALPEPVVLPRAPARLLCIPARTAIAVPSGPVIINETLVARSVRLSAYHPISGNLVLALADNNPLSMNEAHPDKSGNAVDLGGHPVSTWVSALSKALDRIARYLPDLRAEMDLHLSQIIPVGYDAEKHLSASYQEILGTVYLSLHPSSMTLSEALIHEFSHNKLNALFEDDAVLENAWSPLYTSPVRPDPRPLHGVLLAVHAFLPVARLYEQMIAAGDPMAQSESFRARFAEIRRINREGAELVLDKGRPTAVGRGLWGEIRRWHEHYARFEQPS